MGRKTLVTSTILIATALLLYLTPAGAAVSDEIQKVLVTNFPALQQVAGTVGVEGTIRHAAPHRFEEILVPPVDPKDTGRLVKAGTLVTEGFTSVILSLAGRSQGKVLRPGDVGALLVPDEEPILRALDESGQLQFTIEVRAEEVTGTPQYFASKQERFTVGFARYRVLLYNTTDKGARVNLYAYLTN